jgi:hypothetical protein
VPAIIGMDNPPFSADGNGKVSILLQRLPTVFIFYRMIRDICYTLRRLLYLFEATYRDGYVWASMNSILNVTTNDRYKYE